jgi:hypothetical protein
MRQLNAFGAKDDITTLLVHRTMPNFYTPHFIPTPKSNQHKSTGAKSAYKMMVKLTQRDKCLKKLQKDE